MTLPQMTPELSAMLVSISVAVIDYMIGRAKSTPAKNLLHGLELGIKEMWGGKTPPAPPSGGVK